MKENLLLGKLGKYRGIEDMPCGICHTYINKTQVFTLQVHINMQGAQFLTAASANPNHPSHFMLAHHQTPHSIKTTLQALYTGLLNTIPQH